MRSLFALLALWGSFLSQAQPISGVKTVPGDYASIGEAITMLNTHGVGAGGVIVAIAAGHTEETTSAINLTATGTATTPIVFQKSGTGVNPKITRTDTGSLYTSALGGNGDGVIIIEGGDYITFNSIDVSAIDQGIEYGYFFRKRSETDGAKFVTVQNATITMTKGTSAYVTGIFVSSAGSTSLPNASGGLYVTSAGGRHENITLTGNTISNVFCGIQLRGSNNGNYYDQNISVGTAGAGNTIENFGGNASGTTSGIFAFNQDNLNVSYNTINNTAGGGSSALAAIYGIYASANSSYSIAASNNAITLTAASSSSNVYGLYKLGPSSTINFSSNTIALHTSAAHSGPFAHIYNTGPATAIDISNNTFVGTDINTTGSTYLIYNSSYTTSTPIRVRNNRVSGTLNRTGTSGALTAYTNNNSTNTLVEEISGNDFSHITVTGTTNFFGILSQLSSPSTHLIFNNTISDISVGTGITHGMYLLGASTRNVYNNQVHSISAQGQINGIFSGSGFINGAVYNNKIYNLTATAAGGTVTGIHIVSGTAPLFYNNTVGDLKAPVSSGLDVLRGIHVNSTFPNSTVKLYYNTIYLNASSAGTNFGTSGIYHTTNATATTATLDMRNNIIVNTSVPSGGGYTVAYRRSSFEMANYAASSNNNLFYAGTPSASNLIYYDYSNADQTLATFQARVAGRESNSISVLPSFTSTNGEDAAYLHLTPGNNAALNGAATPLAEVTTDFNGVPRDATSPDLGVNEITPTPLPVRLTHFTGKRINATTVLRWTTASENRNRGFAVERSADGVHYNTIGFVSSQAVNGNSTQPLHYQFSDGYSSGPKLYYRLRQEDFNGTVDLSTVVVISEEKTTAFDVKHVFPNPATTQLHIRIATPVAEEVILQVLNGVGHTVKQQIARIGAGPNTVVLSMSGLPPGAYLLKITGKCYVQPVIKPFTKQ